jgi:hypothetical protein
MEFTDTPNPTNCLCYDGRMLSDLVMRNIQVRWEKKWYPAFLLSVDSDGKGLVEFDDPEFHSELIEASDIRSAACDVLEPEPERVGAFDKQSFKKFVSYMVNDDSKVLREFTQADIDSLRNATPSMHALERRDERYGERLQEFQRSLNTPQDCYYMENKRYALCFNTNAGDADAEESACLVEVVFNDTFTRICAATSDITRRRLRTMQRQPAGLTREDLENIQANIRQAFSTREQDSNMGKETLAVIEALLGHAHISLAIESGGEDLATVLLHSCAVLPTVSVYTTTSTLIFSADFSTLVTCFFYPHEMTFSEWKKRVHHQNKLQKAVPEVFDSDLECVVLTAAEKRGRKIDMEREAKGKNPLGAGKDRNRGRGERGKHGQPKTGKNRRHPK